MTLPNKWPMKAAGKKISPAMRLSTEPVGGDRGTSAISPLFDRIVLIPAILRNPIRLTRYRPKLDDRRHTGLLFSYKSERISRRAGRSSRYPSGNANLAQTIASEGRYGST
jgi:hypothetical protein